MLFGTPGHNTSMFISYIDHEFLSPDSGTSKDEHHASHRESDSQRMTNADFRKMMMTPRSDKNMTAMK